LLALFTVAVVLLLSSGPARATNTEARYVPGEILLRFRAGTDTLDHERTALRIEGEIVKRDLALDYAKIQLRAGISVEEALGRLQADPTIEWAQPNYLREALDCTDAPQDRYLRDTTADPALRDQWGIFRTAVYSLWRQIAAGDPTVKIGIVDSGINNYASPHSAIAANVLNGPNDGFDYVQDDNDPTDAGPNRGHGTKVAGVAAAVADDHGIVGVAPCAKMIFVRVLDCNQPNCEGSSEDIADGIRFAADKDCDVINLSLGGVPYAPVERAAVLYAIKKGAILVAASGNDSTATLRYPARFPEVIAVGASTPANQIPAFSNYGENLDVVAPGTEIWTCSADTAYAMVNGTSFATPFVSGICALLRARFPEIKQHEAEAWLRTHTIATDQPDRDGFGRVDYRKLQDRSDFASFGDAAHENHFWEWMGNEVSHEESTADPKDDDGVPNGAGDGGNDGTFPRSFSELPYLPWHLTEIPDTVHVTLTTARAAGPRYGPTFEKSLHLTNWFDWNSDGTYHPISDYRVSAFAQNPATWGVDQKEFHIGFAQTDEHILGNPLTVRTRLAYGEAAITHASFTKYGEVEETRFINFVEEFDRETRLFTPPLYMTMESWTPVPDPQPLWSHHGRWEFASSPHPTTPPCDFDPGPTNKMISPVMDWREYTKAYVKFDYCHQILGCPGGGGPDLCRFELVIGGSVVFTTPIPGGAGTMSFDFSSFVGPPGVEAHIIMQTDRPGLLYVDDVRIWAYDDSKPAAISSLDASRQPGGTDVRLVWTDPEENSPPVPGANPWATSFLLRCAKDPIDTLEKWDHATVLTPQDAVGTFPVPTNLPPGTGIQDVVFRLPSAHQGYSFAVRTGDEVTNVSTTWPTGTESTIPTLAVSVAGVPLGPVAPGSLVPVQFELSNNGGAQEAFQVESSDSRDWHLGFEEFGQRSTPSWRLLDYGDTDVLEVWVQIPGGSAGDVDTVTVVATALSSGGTVNDSDQVIFTVSGVASVVESALPSKTTLRLVGASPSRGPFSFRTAVPRASDGVIDVFDATGKRLRTIARGPFSAGIHDFSWDGTDDAGRQAPSGVYAARLQIGDEHRAVRIVRIR
jgi:thermitase